jgi:hypothetical protein
MPDSTSPHATSPKRKKRQVHNPAAKRSREERERDLGFIAEMRLERHTGFEIREALNGQRPYQLSLRQIQYDLVEIDRRWKQSATLAVEKIKARELANIDWTEREEAGGSQFTHAHREVPEALQIVLTVGCPRRRPCLGGRRTGGHGDSQYDREREHSRAHASLRCCPEG